jgi:hypothetical protein
MLCLDESPRRTEAAFRTPPRRLFGAAFFLCLGHHAVGQEHAEFIEVGNADQSAAPTPRAPSQPQPALAVLVSTSRQESTLKLNRHLFGGNVLQSESDHADQWLVYFCPAWYEPCQYLMTTYSQESADWQQRLNTDLFRLAVRFANVDCAPDKVLCNEQEVEEYPTVVHYYQGKAVAKWTPSGRRELNKVAERLQKWIRKQLEHPPVGQPEANSGDPISDAMSTLVALAKASFSERREALYDLAVVLALLPLSFWAFVARSHRRHQAAANTAKKAEPLEEEFVAGAVGAARRRCLPESWAAGRPSLVL